MMIDDDDADSDDDTNTIVTELIDRLDNYYNRLMVLIYDMYHLLLQ